MKATLQSFDTTTNYSFTIEHDGVKYDVTVYLNDKGRFIDDTISFNGSELKLEGTEGQIREDIIAYLDENWDNLIG